MELSLSTIADICGIVGFIISLIAIGGVIKINKRINSNNVTVNNTPYCVGDDYNREHKTLAV